MHRAGRDAEEGLVGHDGANKTQDCVEFRESGVDEGVGDYVVAL